MASDAGPELAGREGHAAMESPQALIAPLERECPLKKYVWMIRESNKSSSDDRPGTGICNSKYVEDAKAARSVRVWDNSLTTWRRSTDRRINRASSDAGPELAGRESHRGDGKPIGPDRPLGKGVGGIKTKESPQTNV